MELLTYLALLSVLQLNTYDVLGIRISQTKCDEYRRKFPLTAEVFKDEDAAPKEFPFMARIHEGEWSWNGILISENFVLTTIISNVSIAYVILGDLDKGTDKDDVRLQRFHIIEDVYDDRYDILLLKLNGTVEFNEYVRPACLPKPESEISQQLLQIGWGHTNIRSNTGLHKVQQNYVHDKNCTELHTSVGDQDFARGIARGQIFCAGVKDGDRKLYCLGHYGSAMVNFARRDTQDEIVGIGSLLYACISSFPTGFLRVSSYISWIESIVWPNETVSDIMVAQSTLMSHTTNEIKIDASTTKKGESSEEPTTHKVDITTESSTSTTTEPTTHKVDITTESSTSTTTELYPEEETKSTELYPKEETKSSKVNYIIIIVAALLLSALVACLCFRSRNSQNIAVNVVQYTH